MENEQFLGNVLSDHLTKEFESKIVGMIDSEIKEITGSISNEHYFELGSTTDQDTKTHSDNIEAMKLYIENLKELKRKVQGL